MRAYSVAYVGFRFPVLSCVILAGYRPAIPSASQIALSVPWRASAADQTFSVNRKYFIVSCICAQKQYVDFISVILDLQISGFALARPGSRARSPTGCSDLDHAYNRAYGTGYAIP